MTKSRARKAGVLGAVLSVAFLPLVACSGTDRPEPAGSSGGEGGVDLPRAEAGAHVDADAHADVAAADADAGDAHADGGEGGVEVPPLCDTKAVWSADSLLALPAFNNALLGSVTPDELAVAWSRGPSQSVTVFYAERASIAAPFGSLRNFNGDYALDRAALSPDALRITMVRSDRRGFVQRSRLTTADAFGPEESGLFINLETYATATMPADEKLGDPLIGASDRTFLYSQFGGARTRSIQASYRLFANDPWPVGQAIAANAALDATATLRRRPTGLSADQRTLFFFDETTSKQWATWNKSAADDFTTFVELGNRPFATPNLACDRVYFATGGTPALATGIAFATRQ